MNYFLFKLQKTKHFIMFFSCLCETKQKLNNKKKQNLIETKQKLNNKRKQNPIETKKKLLENNNSFPFNIRDNIEENELLSFKQSIWSVSFTDIIQKKKTTTKKSIFFMIFIFLCFDSFSLGKETNSVFKSETMKKKVSSINFDFSKLDFSELEFSNLNVSTVNFGNLDFINVLFFVFGTIAYCYYGFRLIFFNYIFLFIYCFIILVKNFWVFLNKKKLQKAFFISVFSIFYFLVYLVFFIYFLVQCKRSQIIIETKYIFIFCLLFITNLIVVKPQNRQQASIYKNIANFFL